MSAFKSSLALLALITASCAPALPEPRTVSEMTSDAGPILIRGVSVVHPSKGTTTAPSDILINGGKIIEIGAHAELMTRQGFYYHLYQSQLQNSDTQDDSVVLERSPDTKENRS